MKVIALFLIFTTFNVMGLTPDAEKGKLAVPVCMSCHNPELNPPLAPPFYGVQNKYKMKYTEKQDFIKAISHWVKKPSLENALMQRPIKMLGFMPAMPLPEDMLESIAAYLYEEEFAPPCTHWANDLKNGESMKNAGNAKGMNKGNGKGGNNHDAMVRKKYDQLCQ